MNYELLRTFAAKTSKTMEKQQDLSLENQAACKTIPQKSFIKKSKQ